ncbi:MAG: NAD(P)H-binding protein [Rhizobacter sp.]|nr:NAD(P)H-binding protein [Bacteriovorax sp.]
MSRILIAGASGFIGQNLLKRLDLDTNLSIVALSRQKTIVSHERLEWRQADLFSLKDITIAMQGCDQVVYLVHSMLPSASLVQGKFYDLDLILADNFARAAKNHRVSHIVYLGGLLPEDKTDLSWHLKSRYEVEKILKAAAPKVTVLRAGMVLGANGSSFVIMKRLVERLPVMICPSWTDSVAQTIDVHDLISVLRECLVNPEVQGQTWDVGGKEVMTYLELMKLTADVFNRPVKFLKINLFSPHVSRFWVSLVTGAPKALVYPLIQSLKHSMLVRPDRRFPKPELMSTPIRKSIERIVNVESKEVHAFQLHPIKNVTRSARSVQRLLLPPGKDALWVAEEYFKWLPRFFSFIIKTKITGNFCYFYFIHPKIVLLILEKNIDISRPDRQLLYVRGGLLSGKQERARLEFREVMNKKYIIAGIHDFRPSLPWYIYRYTQALVHLFVMKSFGIHLRIKSGVLRGREITETN